MAENGAFTATKSDAGLPWAHRLVGGVLGAVAHALVAGIVLALVGALVGAVVGLIWGAWVRESLMQLCAAMAALIAGSVGAVVGAIRGFVRGNRDGVQVSWVAAIVLAVTVGLAVKYLIDQDRYARAQVLIASGVKRESLADLTEAIRLVPHDANAYYQRGLIQARQGIISDEALKDFTQAIQLNPRHADAFYARARQYWARNDRPRYEADLREAIRLDPALGKQVPPHEEKNQERKKDDGRKAN